MRQSWRNASRARIESIFNFDRTRETVDSWFPIANSVSRSWSCHGLGIPEESGPSVTNSTAAMKKGPFAVPHDSVGLRQAVDSCQRRIA